MNDSIRLLQSGTLSVARKKQSLWTTTRPCRPRQVRPWSRLLLLCLLLLRCLRLLLFLSKLQLRHRQHAAPMLEVADVAVGVAGGVAEAAWTRKAGNASAAVEQQYRLLSENFLQLIN